MLIAILSDLPRGGGAGGDFPVCCPSNEHSIQPRHIPYTVVICSIYTAGFSFPSACGTFFFSTLSPPTHPRASKMGEVTEIPAPIPVVTVTARSPPSTWRRLEEAIDTADFIALDLVRQQDHYHLNINIFLFTGVEWFGQQKSSLFVVSEMLYIVLYRYLSLQIC